MKTKIITLIIISTFYITGCQYFTLLSEDEWNNEWNKKKSSQTSYPSSTTYYSVTYNGNGNTLGSVPTDSNSYSSGASVAVLANTDGVSCAGYKFDGWNTNASGTGTTYTDGSTFSITANITLYAKWTSISYNVGSTGPAGGYIAYVNSNYGTDGWMYMEAAPASTETSGIWGDDTVATGATSDAIGAGKSNTALIVSILGSFNGGAYAAKICDDLTVTYNGITYYDWFLPTNNELIQMESCSAASLQDSYYWASTENLQSPIGYADSFQLSTYHTNVDNKATTIYPIRAIRMF